MPIYEYLCNKCGQKFEYLQSHGEKDLRIVCPKCESPDVMKMFSSFASPGSSGGESCGPKSFG